MNSVTVSINVYPKLIDNKKKDELSISGYVTNIGVVPIDIMLHSSELCIDDMPSFEWSLAIGNGTRDPKEESLPPGDRVEFSRNLAGSVFASAGVYSLQLKVLDCKSPAVTVVVKEGDGGLIDSKAP